MVSSVLFQSDAVCCSYCYSIICHCYCLVCALWDMLVHHLSLSLLLPEGALRLFSDSLCPLSCFPHILHDLGNVNIPLSQNCSLYLLMSLRSWYEDIFVFILWIRVGCVILYVGQGKFHSRTSNTLEYIVDQADGTAENLKNLSEYLSSAKSIGVDSIFLSADIQKGIDDIGSKIGSVSSTLTNAASDNSDTIQKGLDEM